MGRTAVNLLIGMIENDRGVAETQDVVLTPTLVVRGSTAPPPTSPVG
jgi:DNA-binding LacI/PurR family transcriptional regulator